MKISVAILNKWYNEYNNSVFDGFLPYSTISLCNTRRMLGQAHDDWNGHYSIRVSTYYDRNEEQYRNTLVHEMCHIYCYAKGWKNEHHGARWKAIASKATRLTGLDIQRTANLAGTPVSDNNIARETQRIEKKNAPVLVLDIDYGKYHFLVKTTGKYLRKDASTDMNCNLRIGSGKLAGIYVSTHKRFQNWQTSRSVHRGYKFDNWRYENEIAPALADAQKIDSVRRAMMFY